MKDERLPSRQDRFEGMNPRLLEGRQWEGAAAVADAPVPATERAAPEGTVPEGIPLSREEVAKIEIGRTDISRRLAVLITIVFLAAIFAVPGAQHVREIAAWRAGERSSSIPEAWTILKSAIGMGRTWRRTGHLDLPERVLAVNRGLLRELDYYERGLEENSWLTRAVLPHAQYVLARGFGVGNEKTYLGRDKWLFYRPEIDYLTGPGFLSPTELARRRGSADEWSPAPQPHPVEAIVRFRDQLASRGIELWVMPLPGKASVHPERFSPALADDRAELQNRSYAAFVKELRTRGVRVFDAGRVLRALSGSASGGAAYLATDTHWTPAAMERVAVRLAEEVRPRLSPAPADARFLRGSENVTNVGDLGAMLKLPVPNGWLTGETVGIRPVRVAETGAEWTPDPSAEVLLLGDSYTNIYSLGSMGWGEGAGLAEQLSRALNRPVDAIVQNDAGAYATRERLAHDLARGRDRLAGKRVVIWEFAERELAQGDWKRLDLSVAAAPVPVPPLAGPSGLHKLTGAHTRVVWMQAIDPASTDAFGMLAGFRLMGLDTDDGLGARAILPGPLSCRKPLITPDGRQVVFTDSPRARVMAVNWDGSGLRELADGHATDVVLEPGTGRVWVYAIQGNVGPPVFAGRPLVRFQLDDPLRREVVWDKSEVSVDNLQVSSDGRRAAGLFPWPKVAIADLERGTLTEIGRGCWTSLAPHTGEEAWFFDGAHRNLIMEDPATRDSWMVSIQSAPGVEGYEVYHPRWSNHRRFFAMTGPFKAGEGTNRIQAAGREVEIHVGRFADDLRRVERWARVTTNGQPDFFPDVWVDPVAEPAFDPGDVEPESAVRVAGTGRVVLEAKVTDTTRIPTLASIAPYQQALVAYAYEVVAVHEGEHPGPRIQVLHWGIRNGRPVPLPSNVGQTVRLTLESFESHHELQGERVVKEMVDFGLPIFYALDDD
jgi:alginate O-acetyltransferase complex protein AlgJ